MTDDPVRRFFALSNELALPLATLRNLTDPAVFDTKFTEIEGKIAEWKRVFGSVDKNDPATVDAVIGAVEEILPLLSEVHQTSVRIGASKGQGKKTAAAAGGKRRKMSRKYCKKTVCKKMGFTQRASCRPYKNCFTRKQGRSRY